MILSLSRSGRAFLLWNMRTRAPGVRVKILKYRRERKENADTAVSGGS